MAIQYACKDERRRDEVRKHKTLNGIDYLHVLDLEAPAGVPPQRTLLIRLMRPLTVGTEIGAELVTITGGVRIQNIGVEWVMLASNPDASAHVPDGFFADEDPNAWLIVRVDSAGDYSDYRLCVDTEQGPFADFDPVLSSVDFSFKVECESDFDCASDPCPTEFPLPAPLINYLAKDYASFRQLMLDRLAVVLPDWEDRTPADVGMALVEVFAYAADRLSYYQDAVANEAYLGTARKRASVRRHARLLDYQMHEGCNARVWVQVLANADATLESGTLLLTRLPGVAPTLSKAEYTEALNKEPEVFATMQDAFLTPAHKEIKFYTWADERCCLPKGATRATLSDNSRARLRLRPGDVLVFEETRCPEKGRTEDADPTHRHAVRLTFVTPEASEDRTPGDLTTDPLKDDAHYVEIEWDSADALPFPLCLQVMDPDTKKLVPAAVARGNIVLADHGRPVSESETIRVSGDPPRPRSLVESRITYAVPYEEDKLLEAPASEAIAQDPRDALPAVTLTGDDGSWIPRLDLLDSDRFARHFVVEMDEDRTAWIRFGDDVLGQRPHKDSTLTADYRVGNGTSGNVGIDAIHHVVTTETAVTGVRNPTPAEGGTDPESMESVRLDAPYAFRTQKRAVTEKDYAEVAERHPEVQQTEATRRWTGSWHTIFLTIDRAGGRDVDAKFEEELRQFLSRYRMTGHDLEIDGPDYVPLDIAMSVCIDSEYFPSDVQEALLEAFSNRSLPGGQRGFFHPDNFTFGQPVYLSAVVSRAMEIPGVQWVDLDDSEGRPNRFRRWGEPSRGEVDEGLIEVGRLEIVRLDNDPNRPENGKIEFIMEGGR